MDAEEVWEMAYARLGDVTLGEIAAPTELLNLLHSALSGIYQFGSAVNPMFFGAEADLSTGIPPLSPTGWLRPVDAISVLRLELSTGVEVAIVPFDHRDIEPSSPAVYEVGQEWRPAGNVLDPALAETLHVWYSRFPVKAAAPTDPIDALFPAGNFAELLALELAIYIALKNATTMDVSKLEARRNEWAERFAIFLERATLNVTRSRSVGRGSRQAARTFLASMGQVAV